MLQIMGYIKGLIVLCVGLAAAFSYWIYQHQTLWILLLGIFIAYQGVNILYQNLKLRFDIIHHQQVFALQNFHWYIKNNPKHLNDDLISCKQCRSKAIQLHVDHRAAQKQLLTPVSGQVYHRHQCKQCAAVLFYTPHQG